MSDGRVVIDTRIDPKGAVRDVHNLESTLKPALKRIQTMLITAFSVSKLVQFGRQAVELASDIEEVQNVVDTAFGDMAYKMEEFANTAIETYGISKLTAKRTGSTYMAMAKDLGLSMEEASDMSITLTGLTADMASFYNVSQDVADTAIKSVFTGETESLKRYGIVMTEVNLQEFAYKQGIDKKISAMTQAEKVQLRYNYVMSQTTLAQGDFAKTSDSWANQTRILSERWKEFLSIVGTGLIQILTPALRVLNDFLSTMISLANAIAKAFGGNSIKVTKQQKDNIAGIVDATEDATEATKDLSKAQQGLSNLDELNVVQKETSTSTDDLTGGTSVASGIGGSVNATKEVPESNEGLSKLQQILEPLSKIDLTNLNTALGNLKTALGKFGDRVGEGLKWLYDNVLVPFAKWTLEEAVPSFLGMIASALNLIVAIWDSAKPVLGWLWNNFLKPIAGFAGDVVVNLFTDIGKFLDKVSQNQTVVDILAGITLGIGAIVTATKLTTAMTAFSTWLTGLSTLGQIAVGIGVALIGFEIGKTLYEKVPSIQEASNAIVELFGDLFTGKTSIGEVGFSLVALVKDTTKTITEKINKVLKPLQDFFFKMFCKIGEKVLSVKKKINEFLSGIGDFFYKLYAKIKDKVNTLKKSIKENVINKLGDFFYKLYAKIKESFKTVKYNIKENIVDKLGEFIYNLISKVAEGSDAIKTKINNVFSKVGDFIFKIFAYVVSKAQSIKNNINNILKKVGDFTVGIAITIKTKWKDFKSTVKGWLQNMIDFINDNFIDKINNLFTVKIPNNAVTKFLGINGWGGQIITIPSIPHLATGAVLPANNPFLAMVGDQKHGTNIEAPLDTIVEAFRIANRENQQRVTFEVVGDPTGMFKIMQKEARNYSNSKGRPAF